VVSGCLAFAAAIFVAHMVATRVWRAMGGTLRTLLRPLGLLGPLPVILVMVISAGTIAFFARGLASGNSFQQMLTGGPTLGDDFAGVLDAKGRLASLTLPEALKACAARGPGWRVPTTGDEAFLRERLTRYEFQNRALWSEASADDKGYRAVFSYDVRDKVFRRTLGSFGNAGVVCVRR
jgi:hypothetical protein